MKKSNFGKNIVSGIIIIFIMVAIYLGISIYYVKHFNIGTVINGVNVSGKNIKEASEKISSEINNYKLQIKGREDSLEEILGENIELKYNGDAIISNIMKEQNQFKWGLGIFKKILYENEDLSTYNEEKFSKEFSNLLCIGCQKIIEPKNARLEYVDGGYVVVDEVYGNKIKKDVSMDIIINAIITGKKSIDLEILGGFENPKYTKDSQEILDAKRILDKYVSTEVTYKFGDEIEHLEGSVIKSWISIDENLNVEISEKRIRDYIDGLASLYNTVGKTREFNTEYGKKIYVYGGYYGWRIDKEEEFESLKDNIENGEIIDKEPIYAQKGVCRGKDDIGDTYVEISLNKQYVWFHKEGKIVAQGDMVSGDVGKGYKTAIGTYMLTYKQKSATLKGENYASEVKYWMPFNGNIGLHDASWRSSFGGEIFKLNGSHGCINLPEYTAKKIFEEIEEGTPIVCYYD